jgi:hypothetical protein
MHRSLRDVVVARGLVDRAVLDRLLSRRALTGSGRLDVGLRRRLQARPAFRAYRAALR